LNKLRIPLAIVAGAILGNLYAIVAAAGIDASYGEEVTGGQWGLTLPNVIYAAIIGFLTGFFAGFIGKKRGALLGAMSQFLPLLLAFSVALYLNRDILGGYQVKPAVWTWIGLVPAIIGGVLGARLANNKTRISLLKSVRWHWSWLWIVLMSYVFVLAGSIRFLLSDLLMLCQILFKSEAGIVEHLTYPIFSLLFLATISLPFFGVTMLLEALGKPDHGEQLLSNVPATGRVCLAIIGVPVVVMLLWYLNSLALHCFLPQRV
jgi:hypothetical protein